MIKIGLTGNAGSGKTTALEFFLSKGIDGISSDSINADLRSHCKYLSTALENMLNTKLADDNGLIDTALLRGVIFSSKSTQKHVEMLLHPIIMENIDLQIALLSQRAYCIIEIPLLYEADLLSQVDSVLLITADREQLLRRLTSRSQLTVDDATDILDNQMTDNHKFRCSNDIVLNDDTQENFLERLQTLHIRYS